MISIMIVGEADLARRALAAVLAREADLEVVADIPVRADVVAVARAHHPSVVILDIDGSGGDGLARVSRLAGELRECRVLVLTRRQAPATVPAALAPGASGLVSPDASPEQLARWVRRVAAGERVIDPALAAAALAPAANPLTAHEQAVLRLAGEGRRSQEIAAELFLAPGTVRNYLSAAVRKTGSRNRLEAFRRAQEAGWL